MKTFVTYNNQQLEILVHENEFLSSCIARSHRFFEEEILDFLLRLFPGQQTIVDIGANLGNHALFFSHFMQPARLICIEPFKDNFSLLSKNLAARAELFNIGLADAPGRAQVSVDPQNLGRCILNKDDLGEIELRTLDDFSIDNLSLLKIDVEGDHREVLLGARNTLARQKPVVLVEGEFNDLFEILAPLGYLCIAAWRRHNTFCFVKASPEQGRIYLPLARDFATQFACYSDLPSDNFKFKLDLKRVAALFNINRFSYDCRKYQAQFPDQVSCREFSTKDCPTLKVFQLQDICVLVEKGLIINLNGYLIAESSRVNLESCVLEIANKHELEFDVSEKLLGTWVSLLAPSQDMGLSWLLQALLQVVAAESQDSTTKYLVNSAAPVLFLDFIKALGVSDQRIVHPSRDAYLIERLLVLEKIELEKRASRPALKEFYKIFNDVPGLKELIENSDSEIR